MQVSTATAAIRTALENRESQRQIDLAQIGCWRERRVRSGGGNLPSVNIMNFIVHPRDRMLVIETRGHSVWAMDVSKIGGR